MSNLCRQNNKQLFKNISSCLGFLGLAQVCMLCEQSLKDEQFICQNCVTALPWTGRYCEHCAQDVIKGPCGPCQKNPPPFNRVWVALDYAFPIDQLVRGSKFSHQLGHLRLLAELFMNYWRTQPVIVPDILIPVPLHAQRLRERGYNQSLELARVIGKQLGVPVDFQSVKRVKTTLAQAHLSASGRELNVDHAFDLTRPITYSKVALVDDVFTTGSTVSALSQVLRRANVAHIEVYCMARTPIRY